MKVFIAGASGALGLPTVRELVSKGHEVTGLTRSKENVGLLEQLGARAVVADALDRQALLQVVREAAPTHIVDLLTAFPDTGPVRPSHMVATNNLRTKGTANLLEAATSAGAVKIVAESYFSVYGYGDHGVEPLSEDAPFKGEEGHNAAVDAIRAHEAQLRGASAAGKIEAVVLRFGSIYGPENPGTQAIFSMLRRHRLPVVKGADGLTPCLHTADAASAIAAALERGRSGAAYNIADNTRSSFTEFIRAHARAIGAQPPPEYPRWLMNILAPGAVATAASRIPISTALAKRELGWNPRFPDFHRGLEQVAQQTGSVGITNNMPLQQSS